MVETKYTIRENNEATILKEIILHQEISRIDLSYKTGLNKASVSSITRTLLDQGLIYEKRVGKASKTGGPKPILLSLHKKAFTVLSFDLGYDYIEGILTYANGEIIQKITHKNITLNASNALSYIKEMIDTFIKLNIKSVHGIIGASIAVHGTVKNNKAIFTPYYDLDKIDLYHDLKKEVPFAIYLNNEANLAALGEYTFASKHERLISISIHSGIGAGLVEYGDLTPGSTNQAGEIGHTIIDPHGRVCPCGNQGCIEQYASNKAIYQQLQEKKNLETLDSDILSDLIKKEDPDTLEVMNQMSETLAIGINNAAVLFDPDIVILNSAILLKNPTLLPHIKKEIKSTVLKDLRIELTQLNHEATLLGGIAYCIKTHLNIKQLKIPR